jgi:hypothetical protein
MSSSSERAAFQAARRDSSDSQSNTSATTVWPLVGGLSGATGALGALGALRALRALRALSDGVTALTASRLINFCRTPSSNTSKSAAVSPRTGAPFLSRTTTSTRMAAVCDVNFGASFVCPP